MLTPSDRTECINRIKALPRQLERAIAGLDQSQLATPYRKGGWTVGQVVHHLADSHINAFVRMKLILTEDHPTLKPYDQDEWAKLPDVSSPIASSLSILQGLHERWIALLERVPDAAWSRTAHHSEVGEVSLESMLTTYAIHGENHVKQITDLRSARGW
jgi:hypothetical protein